MDGRRAGCGDDPVHDRRLLLGVPVMVATPEDVIVAKLGWAKDGGSQRQLEDVANILAARRDQLDRGYLERWIGELGLADVWARAQPDV